MLMSRYTLGAVVSAAAMLGANGALANVLANPAFNVVGPAGPTTTQTLAAAGPGQSAAANWTTSQLSQSEVDFLSGLSLVANHEPFTMVHGSLRDPLEEYLLDADAAEASLKLLATRFLLVGHSHFPFLCLENESTPQFVEFTEDAVLPLTEQRWIINPGSTGQPRDRDPRSSYAIYDDQDATIERHRVEYDIEGTQSKMQEAHLPEYLIERLKFGI